MIKADRFIANFSGSDRLTIQNPFFGKPVCGGDPFSAPRSGKKKVDLPLTVRTQHKSEQILLIIRKAWDRVIKKAGRNRKAFFGGNRKSRRDQAAHRIKIGAENRIDHIFNDRKAFFDKDRLLIQNRNNRF